MKTVTIPGGNAVLREQDEIRVRHKRLIESAAVAASTALEKLPTDRDKLESLNLAELALTRDEANSLFELQDATIVAALIGWTLTQPLPTLDTIGDIEPAVYDALANATRELGTAVVAPTDFSPSDPTKPGFEESPTQPSGDSGEPLRDDSVQASTETPNINIESIATDATSPV